MSRCVILSACPVQPELKRLLRSDDFIIACDAGYRNCERLGCKPNIIVGDFDSAPCPQQDTDDIVVLPHVKDDTDTEYAAKLALQDERSRITFVLPGESRRYPKEEFFYFSAFPMEGRAEGVYEKGSFYELEDAVLTAGYPLGVSNEYAEGSDCITISTRQGALVVVETIAD